MRPVIFIPGLLGCRLRDRASRRVVWGTVPSLYFNGYFHCLRFRPGSIGEATVLEAFNLVPRLWQVDVYGGFLRQLAAAPGRVRGDLSAPTSTANLYAFAFNWTEDITATVRRLHEAVRAVLAASGEAQVDLIGHSYGGLLARYYAVLGCADLEDARVATDPRPATVARVFLLGTANAGAVDNFRVVHEGFRFAPFAKHFGPLHAFSLEPAFYTFPPPGASWYLNAAGAASAALDLYRAEDWVRAGWAIFSPAVRETVATAIKRSGGDRLFNSPEEFYAEQQRVLTRRLRRAQRLHELFWRLEGAGRGPAYEVLGAQSRPTLARAILTTSNGTPRLVFPSPRHAVAHRELFCPGDGETPFASLTALPGLAPDCVHGVGMDHRRLLQSPRLRRILRQRLERPEPQRKETRHDDVSHATLHLP